MWKGGTDSHVPQATLKVPIETESLGSVLGNFKKKLKILFQVILIIKEIRETLDYAAVHRSVPGWWNIKHLENLL